MKFLKRKALILLSDNSRVDLEWILPLIDEMKQQGIKPVVFDMADPKLVLANNYWMRALRLIIGEDCFLPSDIEPLPRKMSRMLMSLRAHKSRFVAIWGALYFSWKSPIYWFPSIALWRRRCLDAAQRTLIENVVAVYVGIRDEEFPAGTGEAEFLEFARKHSILIIGYPSVVDHEIPLKSMMKLDLALANTKEQALDWQRVTKQRVLEVTPPKYTRRWLRSLPSLHHDVCDSEEYVPHKQKTALAILKNDTSIVWNGIEFHETASQMLARLVEDGYYVLVKFHPRQTEVAQARLLAEFDRSDYCVVEGPLIYWASRVNRVVSLFSGGVLDSLAAGRVAALYWPMSEQYNEKVQTGEVSAVYARDDGHGNLVTKFNKFVQEISGPTFCLPEDVGVDSAQHKAFRTLYEIREDNSELHKYVVALSDERRRKG
ncbi:MAG: hypothetical protein RIB30_07655 [Thalassospira sp.]|uniref:hypothetical protein n=1 Tax=Thalassospira sp. TaxID=1912094 RepID=UPI0032EB8CC7